MPGTLDLFDAVDLTAATEYSSRNGEQIDTLQIHHATTTSYRGLRWLMDPGGRTVSANGGMDNAGKLYEIVPLSRRAFTSATGFDRRCLTVECCNLSLAPGWKISHPSRERFAQLAVAMYRKGLLKTLSRTYGQPGGIIGHSEVPGTYATACPGPDMDLDWISARAKAIYAAGERELNADDLKAIRKAIREEVRAELDDALRAENLVLTARAKAKNPSAAPVLVPIAQLVSADHARLYSEATDDDDAELAERLRDPAVRAALRDALAATEEVPA